MEVARRSKHTRSFRREGEGGREQDACVAGTREDGGGRKKDEGEAKGDNRRQVERRHKFISKKMWDDGPE